MRRHTAVHLHVSASLASSQGQPIRSARLGEQRRRYTKALAPSSSPSSAIFSVLTLLAARAQLDEAAWEDAWAEGRVMTTEQAVVYALERGNDTAHDTADD